MNLFWVALCAQLVSGSPFLPEKEQKSSREEESQIINQRPRRSLIDPLKLLPSWNPFRRYQHCYKSKQARCNANCKVTCKATRLARCNALCRANCYADARKRCSRWNSLKEEESQIINHPSPLLRPMFDNVGLPMIYNACVDNKKGKCYGGCKAICKGTFQFGCMATCRANCDADVGNGCK
ncbi:g5.1 [Tranosema rostrale ichnovirus]|nr:g5.1 [Tranosema rostrale ichnovirus]